MIVTLYAPETGEKSQLRAVGVDLLTDNLEPMLCAREQVDPPWQFYIFPGGPTRPLRKMKPYERCFLDVSPLPTNQRLLVHHFADDFVGYVKDQTCGKEVLGDDTLIDVTYLYNRRKQRFSLLLSLIVELSGHEPRCEPHEGGGTVYRFKAKNDHSGKRYTSIVDDQGKRRFIEIPGGITL